jgi:hypothetical protein
MMQPKLTLNTDAIARAEQSDVNVLRDSSLRERGEWLIAASRAAAALEASRLAMGLPPARPAPWSDSTWQFLAAAAERVRERRPAD